MREKREVNSSLTMCSKLQVERAEIVESLDGIAKWKLNQSHSLPAIGRISMLILATTTRLVAPPVLRLDGVPARSRAATRSSTDPPGRSSTQATALGTSRRSTCRWY